MDEDRPLTPTPASRRPLSRTLVIAALAVLIVIAIVGIVLGRGRPGTPMIAQSPAGGPATTPSPAAAAALASAAAASAAAAAARIVEIDYEPGAPNLPASAAAAVDRLSEMARAETGIVRISASVDDGSKQVDTEPISRLRLALLQHRLQANGIPGQRLSAELNHIAAGKAKPGDVDHVQLSLR